MLIYRNYRNNYNGITILVYKFEMSAKKKIKQ